MPTSPEPRIVAVPAAALMSSPAWWPSLHATINSAYRDKPIQIFPPGWTRLETEPSAGAEGLARELGDHGYLIVAFVHDEPVACGGVLPFRGFHNPIGAEKSADLVNGEVTLPEASMEEERPSKVFPEWEICCFCVASAYRGHGLSPKILGELRRTARQNGATRLFVNYVVEELPTFWTKSGFRLIEGVEQTIEKGFRSDPDKVPLAQDIHIATGEMTL